MSDQLPFAPIVVVSDGGPWAKHNMACAVCRMEHAILDMNSGRFEPGARCQGNGWMLVRPPRWLRWMFR